MRYVLLIYDNEAAAASRSPQEQAAIFQAWGEYAGSLQQTGKMLGGEALQATATATTVRGSQVATGDRSLISDGPFAETKEQLGGYFVVTAADLDEAIAWASKMPHLANGGSVEVRPVLEMDMP